MAKFDETFEQTIVSGQMRNSPLRERFHLCEVALYDVLVWTPARDSCRWNRLQWRDLEMILEG